MTDIELPSLLITSGHSQFDFRCHAASWSDNYGADRAGLVLLSAPASDAAAKAGRALLCLSEIAAAFDLQVNGLQRLARAVFDGKPVAYATALARLAPGVVHLVALAKLPGLMPSLSDDHLWAELSGPRYTTPLLRSWTGWLKHKMIESGGIVMTEGFAATAGVLRTEPNELDELVSGGVKDECLRMVGLNNERNDNE